MRRRRLISFFISAFAIITSIPFWKVYGDIAYLGRHLDLPESIVMFGNIILLNAILLVVLAIIVPMYLWWNE